MSSENAGIKLVLLGDAAVGKSAIVQRLVENTFTEDIRPTIGAAFVSYKVNTTAGLVKLDIWDTAGQERYNSLAPLYYRLAKIAVIVYDVTRVSSFQNVEKWLSQLRQTIPDAIIAIVANKIDMEDERVVTKEEGMALGSQIGVIYAEVSALTGSNITELFEMIAGHSVTLQAEKSSGNLKLDKAEKSTSGCC